MKLFLETIFFVILSVLCISAYGNNWESRWTVTIVNNNNCSKQLYVDAYMNGMLQSKSFSYVIISANSTITTTIVGSNPDASPSNIYTLGLSWNCCGAANVIINGILPNSGWLRSGDANYPYISGSSYIVLGTSGSCTTNVNVINFNDANDGVPIPAPHLGSSDCGMPVWSVSEPYISLWLNDEPLGYQPATGPRISFGLAFNQRQSNGGIVTSFSTGKKWNCSWLSSVAQSLVFSTNGTALQTNYVVNFPGGGSTTYYTTNDYLTQTSLSGDATNGFTIEYPDGGKDVYGFVVTNSMGVFLEAFLSQRWNAQAQKLTLNYSNYVASMPVIVLKNVVDGDGRTNTISYATNNAYSPNLISQVTDPFGRKTLLSYNANGDLTNIVDVANNSTAMLYDANDWVTNMTTPYGVTSFTITDSGTNPPPNGRSVLITKPDGAQECYLYRDNAAGIASAQPTNQVPVSF